MIKYIANIVLVGIKPNSTEMPNKCKYVLIIEIQVATVIQIVSINVVYVSEFSATSKNN